MTSAPDGDAVPIPAFPFFKAPPVEVAFGCPIERYLNVGKEEARSICDALPEESQMADMLFYQGHLGEDQFGMSRREFGVDATPEDIRDTTTALLRSWAPSHEVKRATIAVALTQWFPRVIA